VSQDDIFEDNTWSRTLLESCIYGIEDFLELETASKSGIHKVLPSNDIEALRYMYVFSYSSCAQVCVRSALYIILTLFLFLHASTISDSHKRISISQ
jgi:hypothetical protein